MASRAGSRDKKYQRTDVGFGRLSDRRIMMLRTLATSTLHVNALNPEDHDEENNIKIGSEKGTTFTLNIPVPGRRVPLVWNICGMTLPELEALREFFNNLFDLAEPVVRARDKAAQDAFAEGDDSYTRIYRDVPQLIVRKRQVGENGEGLLDGPSSPPGRSADE